MSSEIVLRTQTNSYCGDSKLKSFPKALFFNIFSFIEESDLACFSSSCKLLSSLQNQYNANLIDNRFNAWKRILNSQPRNVNFTQEGYFFRLIKNQFFWSVDDIANSSNSKRYFMDLTSLTITPNEMEYIFIKSRMTERISVSTPNWVQSKSFIVFDNEKRVQLCKIDLETNEVSIKKVFVTKLKGQTVEFVQRDGVILQLDLNLEEESDKKVSGEKQLKSISCIPKEYHNQAVNYISNAFKIKKRYYFQWKIGPKYETYFPVIALKDINFPDQNTILQEDSESCIEDDHFLYVYFKNVIIIYKGEKVWKKIIIEKYAFDLSMYPSDYGLVVHFYNAENTYISIWDHRKYDLKPQIFALFSKIIKNSRSPIFVQNDLLIYFEDKKWTVFHIAKREFLGTLPIFGRDIHDIVTSNEPIPEHFIVQRGLFGDTSHDFQIFSDKKQ